MHYVYCILVVITGITYSGSTLITAGGLALGHPGVVANSPLLTINPGATLDTTALASGLTMAPGQALNMNGAVLGSLVAGANSTLLGSGTISGSLTAQPGAEIALAGTNVTGTMFVSN